MKKVFVGALAAAALVMGASPASADANFNDHNCAGAVVSSVASPGFGAGVAAAAHAQLVDNFNLRNCGAAPGQNPLPDP